MASLLPVASFRSGGRPANRRTPCRARVCCRSALAGQASRRDAAPCPSLPPVASFRSGVERRTGGAARRTRVCCPWQSSALTAPGEQAAARRARVCCRWHPSALAAPGEQARRRAAPESAAGDSRSDRTRRAGETPRLPESAAGPLSPRPDKQADAAPCPNPLRRFDV